MTWEKFSAEHCISLKAYSPEFVEEEFSEVAAYSQLSLQ